MPRHQKPWREDVRILTRLPEVERRHLAGWPNTRIAKELGVAEVTIREDVKRLAELWLDRIGEEQHTLRARYTAELEDVRHRALAAAEFDEMAERAVLFDEPDENGAKVERPEKGAVSFKGGKAQALNAARQAVMDKAKLNSLLVDRQEFTGEALVRVYERDASSSRT